VSKYFSNIMLGLLFSILWVLIGTILYVNSLSSLQKVSISNSGTKFLPYFLWSIPFLVVVLGIIFIKKRSYKISLISFLVGTIFISLMVPVLFE